MQLSLYALKYWRIVHNPTATKYRERKARKICFQLHLVIPILISILNSMSNGRLDQIFTVDHCWSIDLHDKTTDPSGYDKIKSLFCVNRNYEIDAYFGTSVGNNKRMNPISLV